MHLPWLGVKRFSVFAPQCQRSVLIITHEQISWHIVHRHVQISTANMTTWPFFLLVFTFAVFNVRSRGFTFAKNTPGKCMFYRWETLTIVYTLFQNVRHIGILFFCCKLALVASFLNSKYKRIFSFKRGNKGLFASKLKNTKVAVILE